MKMTIRLHPILVLLLWLCFIAAFLTIPVFAFYVLPKGFVWLVNAAIHQVGIHYTFPFNVITWCVAMYLLWLTGIVNFTTRQLKTSIELATKK